MILCPVVRVCSTESAMILDLLIPIERRTNPSLMRAHRTVQVLIHDAQKGGGEFDQRKMSPGL